VDWINRSISSRIAGSVISAKLMVRGPGLGVETKKELIEWSDGGFVVGCVSRSSSGVFKAMLKCGDFGCSNCGCGCLNCWCGDRGRDISWGRGALFGLITLFGLVDNSCVGEYGNGERSFRCDVLVLILGLTPISLGWVGLSRWVVGCNVMSSWVVGCGVLILEYVLTSTRATLVNFLCGNWYGIVRESQFNLIEEMVNVKEGTLLRRGMEYDGVGNRYDARVLLACFGR
jgi:hypothetical protein